MHKIAFIIIDNKIQHYVNKVLMICKPAWNLKRKWCFLNLKSIILL